MNGRTLLDGWFDPQWLYKLPRTPATLGIRAFGRLAFVDHFRTIAHKLHAELEAVLDPRALEITHEATGLDAATNRPRVYVVAGLGGGTGSGMLLDTAYAVRQRLRKIGYADPDVVGVLLTPPDAPGAACPQAQANAYATLTELHHFSRPVTRFSAVYDERAVPVEEAGAPFRRVFVAPGLDYPAPLPGSGSGVTPMNTARANRTPAAIGMPSPRTSGGVRPTPANRSGSRAFGTTRAATADLAPPDAITRAADFLRLSLFTPAGPLLDEVRPPATDADHGSFVQAFGMTRFGWPRGEVINRTARILATVVVNHWVSPDPAQVRRTIPAWADEQWVRCGLELEALAGHMLRDAEAATGIDTAHVVALGTDRLGPKGWLGRAPNPAAAAAVLDKWGHLIGRPNPALGSSPVLPAALVESAERRLGVALADFAELFPQLVESPQFRLAGAEEAIRRVLARLDRDRTQAGKLAAAAEAGAAAAFELLSSHAHPGRNSRRVTAAEFADALRTYPGTYLRGLQMRTAVGVYRRLKDTLVATLAEISACRQRIEAGVPLLAQEAERPAPPVMPGELLPGGCPDTEQAAQVFLKSLTDDDLSDLEVRVQAGLEAEFGGLYQACLNTTEAHVNVFRVISEQTRTYLDGRLGEVDFAGMLFDYFGGKANAVGGLSSAYDEAAPQLVGPGPWSSAALSLYVGPAGDGGDPAREAAAEALPNGTIDAPSPDEVVIYREYSEVPLGALPQFGPMWAAAYQAFADHHQVTPHARQDVTQWADVDGA